MLSVPGQVARKARIASLVHQSARAYAAYWNKDWRPGPVPKTETQRRAAAKKYGLIPEDYETYPDDGFGYGDYPKLPIISAESRDPHYNFDMDEWKRNYGEPLHVDFDMYGEDRLDYNRRYLKPIHVIALTFFGLIGTLLFLNWTGLYIKICFVKKMPRQMPADGDKHYTFQIEGQEICD